MRKRSTSTAAAAEAKLMAAAAAAAAALGEEQAGPVHDTYLCPRAATRHYRWLFPQPDRPHNPCHALSPDEETVLLDRLTEVLLTDAQEGGGEQRPLEI